MKGIYFLYERNCISHMKGIIVQDRLYERRIKDNDFFKHPKIVDLLELSNLVFSILKLKRELIIRLKY